MTIEAAIYNRLSNHSGLTALTSTRIYPNEDVRKDTSTPYLTYLKITSPRVHAMGVDPGLVRATYRFSTYSESFTDVFNVAIQLKAALDRWRGTLESTIIQDTLFEDEWDLYEDETKLHHRVQQFEIIHEE